MTRVKMVLMGGVLLTSRDRVKRYTMATQFIRAAARAGLTPNMATASRGFQTSAVLRQDTVVAAPVRKPVGAFRGGLFGFLLGATTSGAGMYYYVIDEYRVSNQLLTEDIYALQSAVQRIEGYVRTLEDKVDAKKR
ncbi:Chromosome partition Smc [Pyrenophora seminiperda CCB06]|uniref:Chromosome partition Smc n=1 Tax=Pyrenophora seminiperda CCB06 TaxID=1302712 RepID=A0A3M7M7Z9_9PLEO|nr:Chromosome partition Smc [Pyrenophora seminiperda CCB06]